MGPIKHIVFDYDGTCTQIPAIYKAFLDQYRRAFSEAIAPLPPVSVEEWDTAQDEVRKSSPCEGWCIAGKPCAPVAADPYIMADESAKLISRLRPATPPDGSSLHKGAYHANQAPWRPEARDVLREIHGLGIGIHFVSNSKSTFINGRLDDLLGDYPNVRQAVFVNSGAEKFNIKEPSWGADSGLMSSHELRAKFAALPTVDDMTDVPFTRPIYLHRGSYFEALCSTLKYDASAFGDTLVCGDIWELDLAMPFHLGMHVHLIERAAPFSTYEYEHAKITKCGGKGDRSEDLTGLLKRLKG